jgi:hypothetical protein
MNSQHLQLLLGTLAMAFTLVGNRAEARWYSPETAGFISRAPYPPAVEHPYSFAEQLPNRLIDPDGAKPRPYDQYEELNELKDCFDKTKDQVAGGTACVDGASKMCDPGGLLEQCMKGKGKWPLQYATLTVKTNFLGSHTWCEILTDDMECQTNNHMLKPIDWTCTRRDPTPKK